MANIRIKDLSTDSALSAGDYVVVDSASEGSRKFDLGTELTSLKNDIGDLDDLETEDKSNLVAAINEARGTGGGGGLTQDIKQSLLACFANTMWSDSDGQDYYDDLEEALYPFDLLSSITAVYTQSGTVYDTDSLDSLKADLVVTANYLDSTYKTVTDYTLSGTLVDGTSTITVTYGGKTTTFNVTVTGTTVTLVSIEATYTQSGTVYSTDSLDSLKADLVVTATYSDTSSATIPSTDYTLSGTLAVGTSTITVTYESKTDTFNVTVSQSAATLTSISAVYTQSGTVYDTDTLDSLKTDLVVTAHYSDSTTATVSSSDYTLSGTLTVGTSTVTVTYGGFTTTFTVTVTEHIDTRTLVNNWDFTSSLTDTVGGSTAALTGATQDSTGVHLTASGNRCICNGVITTATDREIELDITEYARQGSDHGRFMMLSGTTGFIYRKTGRWALYLNGAWTDSAVTASNAFNGKTIKMKLDWVDTMVNVSIWCDGAKIVEAQETSANILTTSAKMIGLGSGQSNSAYNSTFTGLRIYEV